ncbi:phosphate ABC transporter permease PstA [candidate division WOR-3 bacterium]|nr:phosphate ABC transporter permease PstA [candidate division WOR-3 bacterium]
MKLLRQKVWFIIFHIAVLIGIVFLFTIIVVIMLNGMKVLSIEFITGFPRKGMTEGGIFPAIIGTLLLAMIAICFALPLGVFAAIYLCEYAENRLLLRIIRGANNALAGTPSVVFGLFGLSVFVKLFGFGVSLLSGGLTLGILILPVIIRATEEAIRAVPHEFRYASYALGATKWQTIRGTVLPVAIPGILTSAILGIGRAAGETAPILFTAATFYTRRLPRSLFDEVMALPVHIYGLMTEGMYPQYHVPIAYGTAFVLLMLVLAINLIAIIIRYHMRRAKRW